MRSRWVYRSSLAVQVVCGFVNCYVAIRVYLISNSPVNYYVNVITPPSFTNNTISVASPKSPSFFKPSHASDDHASYATNSFRSVVREPYRYTAPFSVFVNCGRTFFESSGKYYTEGDTHAYGIVSKIFPERVYFSSGDYLDNVKSNTQQPIRSKADDIGRNDNTSS